MTKKQPIIQRVQLLLVNDLQVIINNHKKPFCIQKNSIMIKVAVGDDLDKPTKGKSERHHLLR